MSLLLLLRSPLIRGAAEEPLFAEIADVRARASIAFGAEASITSPGARAQLLDPAADVTDVRNA